MMQEDETVYEVVIRINSKGLASDMSLSVEILPEWAEQYFREIERASSRVPSVFIAASSILEFIEAGLAEPGEERVAAVMKMTVN